MRWSPPALPSATAGTSSSSTSGSFTFTPSTNFFGNASFSYRAFDGAAFSTATVTLSVAGTNDAPTANADVFLDTEDTVLTVPGAGVLANDTDVDGDSVSAVLLS